MSSGVMGTERALVVLRPHASRLVLPALVLLAAAWPVGWALGSERSQPEAVRGAVLLAAVVGVTYGAVRPFLRWWTTTYELTTRRLSLRWGVLSRHGRDVPLDRLVDVRLSRSLLQRMVGSGTVTVGTAGRDPEEEADDRAASADGTRSAERIELADVPQARRLHALLVRLTAVEEETRR